MILSQRKVLGSNIKQTTLARYFRKVTTHPNPNLKLSFTRLIVIRQMNRVHQISKWRIGYKDSVVFPPYLNLFVMIEVYKYLNSLSPQIMNHIFKLYNFRFTKNVRNVHLFESQNPRTKQYGLHCFAYRDSQSWQTVPTEIRNSL